MKIYLAHPITDYGGPRQAAAVAALKEFRPNALVENPDQPHHQEGYGTEGMAYFKRVVEGCYGLAFMRFPDGSIGAGVGQEIGWALNGNLWLYEVFAGRVYQVNGHPTPVLSVDDTRATIRFLRATT